jgi:hypothetical protein
MVNNLQHIQHLPVIISYLNEFSKAFGVGVVIFGIIGILFGIFSGFWLLWKINDRLPIKRYEKDIKEHKLEHDKLEGTIAEKLNVVSQLVHRIDGYLQGQKDAANGARN